MTRDTRGWIAARVGRLSTGLKMLLILGAGLLPLGIVAVLASLYSARDNFIHSEVEMRALLGASAQRIETAIDRGAIIIRAVTPAIAQAPAGSELCRRTLARLARLDAAPARYALYDDAGVPRCSTPGYAPPAGGQAPGGERMALSLDPGGAVLRFGLYDEEGRLEGAGEFDRSALARMVGPAAVPGAVDIVLAERDRTMVLRDDYRGGRLTREISLSQPVAGGIELRMLGSVAAITAVELLMILLPLMMLIAAALIGWWIVDRLLLRPLVRMQRAVAGYQPGDRSLDLPNLRSPAREIGELGQAFDEVTQTVARHEADLEAAVERQTRLVREVHHRVKNNLQVVASLLNLHARGSTSEDVAAAYASIQRRVDALAVVHRNHYAELEENRGVALRSLISELAANLRATAPASAAHMQIRVDIEPFYVTQDVAVSVAFLVTEIVEFGMFCGASWVSIVVEGGGPSTAELSIESDSLAGELACDRELFERFDRIITGLARQLRSSLERDPATGRYSVRLAVVDRAERYRGPSRLSSSL
ncbi:MAG: sensor histidine kinase [Pseudomonadota bacterium]|nr:sensor histidine kinase [Pseudomonadota bacterium]